MPAQPAAAPLTPYTPAIRILVLCTANVCRSPMAEAFLDRELWDRGVHAEVSSAGRLRGGRWTTPENVDVMARHGVDLTGHQSVQATRSMVRDADLIVAMAREHVRDATTLAPEVFPRCFTLKELVRRGAQVGPRLATEPLGQWLDQVGADRHPAELVGSSPDDDIADPIGEPEARYAAVAAEIAALTAQLVDLAWPPHDQTASGEASRAAPEPLSWTDTD